MKVPLGLALVTSCSFSVGGPSHAPKRGGPPPDCETSAGGRAVLDITGAILSLFIAKFAYSSCYAHEEDCSHPGRAAPWIGIAAMYTGAIVYGRSRAGVARPRRPNTPACNRRGRSYGATILIGRGAE